MAYNATRRRRRRGGNKSHSIHSRSCEISGIHRKKRGNGVENDSLFQCESQAWSESLNGRTESRTARERRSIGRSLHHTSHARVVLRETTDHDMPARKMRPRRKRRMGGRGENQENSTRTSKVLRQRPRCANHRAKEEAEEVEGEGGPRMVG